MSEDGWDDDAGEDAPLAGTVSPRTGKRHRRSPSIASVASSRDEDRPLPKHDYKRAAYKPSTILWITLAIVWFEAVAGGLYSIPITRVLEDIMCRRFYESGAAATENEGPSQGGGGAISEDMCKIETVQSQLASLFAVSGVLDAIFAGVSALPWGIVSDKIGRRPVYVIITLSTLSQMVWVAVVCWAEFGNLNLILLSSPAVLIGGGGAVAAAILYSILTDVLPAAERAVGFMRVHVASMLGHLLTTLLVSILMPIVGPWPLISTGLVLTICSAGSILLLPETKPPNHKSKDLREGAGFSSNFRTRVWQSVDDLKGSFLIFKSAAPLLLIGILLITHPVPLTTMHFINLFAPERYHILISESGYIQSAYGVAHIFVHFFLVPFLSVYVLKPSTPRLLRISGEKKRDLVFAWRSNLAAGLGALIMAISPALGGFVFGLIIMSLGSAQSSLIRSTLASYVDPEHRSRMFTLLSVVDTVAQLYSLPALTGLFTLGMKLGGTWMGLPYFGAAVLCFLASTLLRFVRLPDSRETTVEYGLQDIYQDERDR
ncbi:major facilitator superfamily domain-containing protein [Xylariales sp. PMI_506]|nr:major facilitator superfamily domain-containing protein [Xylariales sp. PMI_506]